MKFFCAICDNTNETTRLCNTCRKNPENSGWSSTWEICVENIDTFIGNGMTLSELIVERGQVQNDITESILRLVAEGKKVRATYFDKDGRKRGERTYVREYSVKEISVKVGCSVSMVYFVVRRFAQL